MEERPGRRIWKKDFGRKTWRRIWFASCFLFGMGSTRPEAKGLGGIDDVNVDVEFDVMVGNRGFYIRC